MVRGMERGRNLYGGWGQKSVGETLNREVATCGTRGAGLGVGGCWWRCRLPAARRLGLRRKALPARRRGPDSGRDGSLGPRGPRDPPPGMR